MVGHGLRYLSLDHLSMEISTLVDAPGRDCSSQGIAGAMRLSVAGVTAHPALAAATLALSSKSVFVVAALAIGLAVGARLAGLAHRHG